MTNSLSLAVVTGGARGIGQAVTRQLLEEGKSVVMLDADQSALEQAMVTLAEFHGRIHARCVDVREASAVQSCAESIEADLGPVDALVTCAGTTRLGAVESLDFADWKLVLDINLDGTFLCCQAFGRAMLARGRGAIVTVSSVSGLGGQSGRASYVTSKWAVIGLTKTLAIEWGHRGLRVNAVAPGPVNTELLARIPQRVRDGYTARTPLGREAQPQELADVIAFLLSPKASFINGVVLPVDGGFTSGYATARGGADIGT